ncbi:MAG: tetratricopeptide repeat protein [Anaerolineae bacterium]|nr:tetratricopeptide repeat protein [Anaerolineae bacterium]
MPGNQQLYEQAMQVGDGYAWDQEWDKAIAAYARALQEYPEDPRSHNSLGFALLEAKRYPDALRVYSRARQLDPNDPLPLEKSADVLERLGRLKEAAEQYIAVADVYIAQGDLDKAIANWERATQLTPGLLQIHFRLAQAFERTGKKRSAILQYLVMAFNFQRAGDVNRALQACERALRLEPSNAQVLNAKRAVESGEAIILPKMDEEEKDRPEPEATTEELAAADSNPEGPLGESTDKALGDLAEFVLDGDLSAATAQAIKGIELHKIGEYEQAAISYMKAETQGLNFPALSMCLGSLFIKVKRWQDAQKYLDKMLPVKEYEAGAAHGLGMVMMGLNEQRKASDYLLRAVKAIDIGLALNEEEASQLEAVYDTLKARMTGMQDGDLGNLNKQYNKMLTGKDWKLRIQETRRTVADQLRAGNTNEIIDMFSDTSIVDSVGQIDRYLKQRMYNMAIEEAHFALEHSPLALPIHQRIAQVLMEDGHIQEAITKYNLVAYSYLARDDMASASSILYEVVKIAPTDVGLRTSLIELLERQEKWNEVLDEYIGLGNAYYELADSEQARAAYGEANRLAQRLNASPDKRIEILARVAELDMSRLDLRQAQRTYEQIRTLAPNDDNARKALVDIYYRLNNAIEATKELDALLRIYAQQRRGDQIITTLEGLVQQRPSDMALRSRMSAVYRQIGRKQDAISQLDALGELQLEAGLYQDACATIKLIIQLGPSEMEQYRTLLQQLGC